MTTTLAADPLDTLLDLGWSGPHEYRGSGRPDLDTHCDLVGNFHGAKRVVVRFCRSGAVTIFFSVAGHYRFSLLSSQVALAGIPLEQVDLYARHILNTVERNKWHRGKSAFRALEATVKRDGPSYLLETR